MAASAGSEPDWKRLDELFQQAMDLPASERAAFIEEACGADTRLSGELWSLLASASNDDEILEKTVQTAAYSIVHQPEDSLRFAPGSEFARYVILSEVGSGGMGKVFVAEDRTLKRRIALKMLTAAPSFDPDSVRRFQKEAEAASALNHPNILTIYEVGEWEGTRFIASEFIDGETIRQRLKNGPMSIPEALEVAIQIAAGLAVAHAAGLIHRDIKPENIIIRSDGLVKIVDFGIARFTRRRNDYFDVPSEGSAVDAKTGLGMVIGTTRYMSPEQARGQKLDARTDIFSLGAVIYETISGHSAFQGDTDSDVIAAILKTDPPVLANYLPRVPNELSVIIQKAMCKDRDGRFADAGDLLSHLRTFRDNLDFQSRLKTKRRVSPALVLIVMVAVLILGVVIWRLVRSGVPSRPGFPTQSLAILPFRNDHPDPATDFLGYSLADAVITKMSYVSSVSVRPSSSIDRYRNQQIDPRKAGAELNVDTLLIGSYLKEDDELRINTQLVDAKSERILWRDSIDVKYDKLLTVQDRVAAQIIAGLELNLSPAEQGNVRFDNPISETAYERYLRGVDLYALNDFAGSIAMLEQATAEAPRYAPAWAHLGQAYATNASQQFGGSEQYSKAFAAYQRALQLNPALIEPHIFIANLFTDTGRAEEAVPMLQAALRSNKNNAEAHWELGYAFRFGGLLDDSLKECLRARELDPQVKINSSALNTFLYLGRYADFLNSLPTRQSAYILFYRGFGEYYLHDFADALKHFDEAYGLDADLLQAEVGEAIALSMKHQNAQGLQLLANTERKIQERGVRDSEGIYKVAQAYAVLHDNQSALRLLKQTVDQGFFPYPYLESDPLTVGVREEPEYAAIASAAKDRYDQFRVSFSNADKLSMNR
jgi:serine/threonine protein kinase